MNAATLTPPPSTPVAMPAVPSPSFPSRATRRGRLHRLSVAQYHTMIDAGILEAGAKVELVEGLLLRKPMTRKPPHDTSLFLLDARLRALLPAEWVIRAQMATSLAAGEPEPDLAVVTGPGERYLDHHPGPTEIGLVCEVSDTTLRNDRGLKLRSYARAGLPVYWIVNLAAGEIEVYTDPHAPAGRRPKYRTLVTYTAGQVVPVVLGGTAVGAVAVSDVIR